MDQTAFWLQLYIWAGMVFCYLIGSIPFGLVFTRLAGLGDVRSIGSGNIGATNVLRTGNKKMAALTLLCDMFKGTLAIAISSYFIAPYSSYAFVVLAGFFAFLGHIFPIWLKFKGGKGVATYLGVCLGLYWPAALVFALVWLFVALTLRYSSLSALIAVTIVPIFTFLAMPNVYSSFISMILTVMSLIVLIKHHANIRRLLSGEESKIGKKGK